MSKEPDIVLAYLRTHETTKEAMRKVESENLALKAENEHLRAEIKRVHGDEVPAGFNYRNYILMKKDMDALGAMKLALERADRENLSLRAKTEHLPEFESEQMRRMSIQIRNLTFQRKELMKRIEELGVQIRGPRR